MADHEHKEGHGEGEGHGGGESHGGGGHGGGSHGGGGHEEGHEGAPEWLISFADNVALMMGFFVILLAMNMGPKAKSEQEGEGSKAGAPDQRMLDFVIAVREGFNNPIDLGSDNPKELKLRDRIKERAQGGATQEGPEGKSDQLQAVRPSDYTDVGGLIIFETGSSKLSGSAKDDAQNVAAKIRGLNWVVEVRGHASPFETLPEHDHMKAVQLSYSRSMAVAQILTQSGVKWEQLRLVACGDSDRLVKRAYDPEGDSANQRVEIVVTKELLPPDPYGRATGENDSSGDETK